MSDIQSYLKLALGSKFDPEVEYGLVAPENVPTAVAAGRTIVLERFDWGGEVFVVVAHPKPAEPSEIVVSPERPKRTIRNLHRRKDS